ncbi:MAG: hypothetical protein Q9227_002640 [Pyrenula ochraceoflavens]
MATATKEDDSELQLMWTEAQTSFLEKTKKSLSQSKIRSLDDAMEDLDQHFNPKNPDNGKKQARVKELAMNVLRFVELLGGIAAQGASMVFAPASLCFNALSFLIAIPAKISKFHDDLAQLFEEISNFMKQFKIYQRIEQYATIEKELRDGTHKLMIQFVDICATAIVILSGSWVKKLKTMSKIALFDNDSGIRGQLDEFRRLVDLHSRISDAVTLEHVVKAEHDNKSSFKNVFDMLTNASESQRKILETSQETRDDVKVVVKDIDDRKLASKQKEQVARICKSLLIPSDAAQENERYFEAVRGDSLAGTGGWLKDIDEYKSWVDLDSKAHPVLLLSGSNGTGKSNLAAAILEDSQSQYRASDVSSMRVSLACFSFGRIEKGSKDTSSKGSHPSAIALKTMATQIANQNINFAKNLDSHLSGKDANFTRDMNAKGLSQELLPPPNMKDISDTIFVLLLDGLDQLPPDEAINLFGAVLAISSPLFRIAITATEETFRDCIESSESRSERIPSIEISEHNEADIKSYIESELKSHKAFQGEAEGISRIVASIRDKLPEIVSGNFGNVKYILDTVNEAIESNQGGEEKIMSMISVDTLKNREGIFDKIIRELNESLNTQEIIQLNELLMWTCGGAEWPTVDHMRAALRLRLKEEPLQGVDDMIRNKYSRLLEIEPESKSILPKNFDIIGYFQNTKRVKREAESETDNDPKISMTISINNVKRSQVQKFFWDLSERIVLDKFQFIASADGPETKETITANYTDTSLYLARRCFELLEGDSNDKMKLLGNYAVENIGVHLNDLRGDADNGNLELKEKEEIMAKLVDLLQSPDCVQRHLSVKFLEWAWWLLGFEGFKKWLNDEGCRGSLTRKQLTFVKRITAGNNVLALQEIATMVAGQWLRCRDWPAESCYRWIDAYLDKLEEPAKVEAIKAEGEGGNQNGIVEEDDEDEKPRPSSQKRPSMARARIQQAIDWAEKEAKILDKDSLWYERLGQTYSDYGENDLAMTSLVEAKRLPGSHWKISEILARTYAESKDNAKAIEEMETVFTRMRKQENLTNEDKSTFISNLIVSARWLIEVEKKPEAIEKLREVIEVDPDHYQGHYELLKVFVNNKQHPEAIKILNEMGSQKSKEEELTQLQSMLMEFSSWDEPVLDYFEIVCQATKDHPVFSTILEILQSTLAFAQDKKKMLNVIDLLLCHGVAQVRHIAGDNTTKALEQWSEAANIGLTARNWKLIQSAVNAANLVLNYHFSAIRRLPSNAPASEIEHHVKAVEKLTKAENGGYSLRLPMAALYTEARKGDEAKKLLLNDMKSGLDYLSDEDPENDYLGYELIANTLMHAGDDLNALSAWSLYWPKRYSHTDKGEAKAGESASEEERKAAEEKDMAFPRVCDGSCKVSWTYADSIWFCKVCDDVQFDDACLEKLKSGTLQKVVCNPEHTFLKVPSWTEELKATGKDRVRVGGEMVDGKREGGQILPVDEWLDGVRKLWGIEKPEKEKDGEKSSSTV